MTSLNTYLRSERRDPAGGLNGVVTFLKDIGLIICPRTGQNRTLYSLRHTYATFALINDGMDIHTLAIQMGTSIGMIERHYSHLTPRLKKDMLTGRRYDVPKGEFEGRQDDE